MKKQEDSKKIGTEFSQKAKAVKKTIKSLDNNGNSKENLEKSLLHAMDNYSMTIFDELAAGASVYTRDKNGNTPLIVASSVGLSPFHDDLDKLMKLADFIDSIRGNDVINARNNAGSTALIKAANCANPFTVNVLLVNGADINAQDGEGRTALMHAVRQTGCGHTASQQSDVVKILLNAGADITLRNKEGKTVYTLALFNGKKYIAEDIYKKKNPGRFGKWFGSAPK